MYTARNLINDSYYLSGIKSKGIDEISGEQIEDGLRLFNEVLAIKTLDSKLIPYFEEYDLDLITGQEKYFIDNLISIETLVFFKDNVRFQTSAYGRKKYFGTTRPEGIKGLPFTWRAERSLNGTTLYLYFLPDKNYKVKIIGKFAFLIVDLNVDLSPIYDGFYLAYLRYALAEHICSSYNITFKPQSANKLKELESLTMYVSAKDLSFAKTSTLRTTAEFNICDYDLGRGWRP